MDVGKRLNQIKDALTKAYKERHAQLAFSAEPRATDLDLTLPGNIPPQGHLHLVTQAIREIVDIFKQIGFTRYRYPEVDTDYYAFEALNMPPDHPARDDWETFYLGKNRVVVESYGYLIR